MEEYHIEYEAGCKIEKYSLNGLIHRDNGPAIIHYDENGNKISERWFKHGYNHNENGPAYIMYDFTGRKCYEGWCINNRNYREIFYPSK